MTEDEQMNTVFVEEEMANTAFGMHVMDELKKHNIEFEVAQDVPAYGDRTA